MTTWMTRQMAASYLDVSVDTIDRYARDGKITKYTVAGTRSIRFKVAELDELVQPITAEGEWTELTPHQNELMQHLGEVAANVSAEQWSRFQEILPCEHISFETETVSLPGGDFEHFAQCSDCSATAEDFMALGLPVNLPCGTVVQPVAGKIALSQLDNELVAHHMGEVQTTEGHRILTCVVPECPSPNSVFCPPPAMAA